MGHNPFYGAEKLGIDGNSDIHVINIIDDVFHIGLKLCKKIIVIVICRPAQILHH